MYISTAAAVNVLYCLLKVKAAFTRSFNKEISFLPYATVQTTGSKKRGVTSSQEDEDEMLMYDEDGNLMQEESRGNL